MREGRTSATKQPEKNNKTFQLTLDSVYQLTDVSNSIKSKIVQYLRLGVSNLVVLY